MFIVLGIMPPACMPSNVPGSHALSMEHLETGKKASDWAAQESIHSIMLISSIATSSTERQDF